MAFFNNIVGTSSAAAQASDEYARRMANQAAMNEMLSNSQQIEAMQKIPIAGLNVPTPNAGGITAPPTPSQLTGGVGLIRPPAMDPVGAGATWEQLQQFTGPAAGLPPTTGITPLTGKVSDLPSRSGPFRDYYPDVNAFGVSPDNNMIQNTAAKIGNSIVNFPGNVLNVSANLIEDPIKLAAHQLLKPEGVALGQSSSNIVRAAGLADAPSGVPSVTTPGVGGAPSSAPGGSSSGVSGSVAQGVAGPAATPSSSREEFIPTDIRNASLQSDASELGYVQEQLLAQRQRITDSTNQVLALARAQYDRQAQQAQTEITRLSQYAEAARSAGNVGLMTKYLDQADGIMTEMNNAASQVEQQALQAQLAAQEAYLKNDLDLWTQQALQAEYEFRNMGDPTRLTQIMAAYGYPIAIEDAGDGNYRIIDITGDGQGKRRQGTFTSQEVGDMFMTVLSEEFRKQKMAAQAEEAAKYRDHQFKLEEIDLENAGDIAIEQAKALLDAGQYQQQLVGDKLVLSPKRMGSGPVYIVAPDSEDATEDGVRYSPVTTATY